MPLAKEVHIEEGLLLLWELDEDLEWLKMQFPLLETDQTFQTLKNKKRQQEWLTVKMMLRHIGCNDLKVYYNENGQPQIKHVNYQHISISHSHQLAGIFLHPYRRVGLDIESLNRNFLGIERKYLSPAEIELAQQNEKWHCLFWCAKEAVFKIAGIPGIHFVDQISVSPKQNSQLAAELKTVNCHQSFQLNYFEHNGHFVVYLAGR
ncbi:4'-phosphopantetheinyl transferase superfamily protein [uncultured Sunxiuqinia sp.]|uniref:4'-phosphopantetheinyl transferase family protein n=1 Tax=uncultured Sunxiuqinia sp. TaxID=1573825 RepID=UPI0030DD0BCB|tara:strand:- start:8419 stop:9036 length:618 start_codon:yes stop_codon:yes gene_type:complete